MPHLSPVFPHPWKCFLNPFSYHSCLLIKSLLLYHVYSWSLLVNLHMHLTNLPFSRFFLNAHQKEDLPPLPQDDTEVQNTLSKRKCFVRCGTPSEKYSLRTDQRHHIHWASCLAKPPHTSCSTIQYKITSGSNTAEDFTHITY